MYHKNLSHKLFSSLLHVICCLIEIAHSLVSWTAHAMQLSKAIAVYHVDGQCSTHSTAQRWQKHKLHCWDSAANLHRQCAESHFSTAPNNHMPNANKIFCGAVANMMTVMLCSKCGSHALAEEKFCGVLQTIGSLHTNMQKQTLRKHFSLGADKSLCHDTTQAQERGQRLRQRRLRQLHWHTMPNYIHKLFDGQHMYYWQAAVDWRIHAVYASCSIKESMSTSTKLWRCWKQS